MCVDVELGTRTASAVAWQAAAHISLLALALTLLDRERVLQQRVLQQHRVLQRHVLLRLMLLPLQALQRHEEVVAQTKPSDRVVGGPWAGPSNPRPAHVIVGPAHIKPV